MTTYNFDREIDRKKTNSLKYDFAVERGRDVDVLPLWVADMDFQASKPVLDALQNAVSHGIFGYSEVKGEYFDALYRWFDSRFDWQPKSEWLVKTPGVVFALAMAVRALTKEGDSVLIQPPVYYPFFEVIRDNNRKIVESPLLLTDGHYEIDFDDLEEKIASQNVKLFCCAVPTILSAESGQKKSFKNWESFATATMCSLWQTRFIVFSLFRSICIRYLQRHVRGWKKR